MKELSSVFSKSYFKRVLGVAAVSFGIFCSTNLNAQVYEPPVENPFGLSAVAGYSMPTFADLDGDGDYDLLVGESYSYGGMKYFENTGTSTNPQFANPVDNPFGITSAFYIAFPTFADLDGDGDQDLLVGELYGNMQYFENTGSANNPQFAAPVTNPFGLSATQYFALPDFADVDGDGDMDLLVGEYYGALSYFENTGTSTSPNFASPIINPFGLASTIDYSCPSLSDFDNDGDVDLLVGEYDGVLQYFENTGSSTNPQFASPVADPFDLQSVYEAPFVTSIDLDSDGDIDILVGGAYGSMHYFKNNLISGTQELSNTVDLKVYPNPVSDLLLLDNQDQIDQVEIFNLLGQSILIIPNSTNQIDVSSLNHGMYTIKVSFSSGEYAINKFQKL